MPSFPASRSIIFHTSGNALSTRPEDEGPSNKLLDVETQLNWLRAIKFENVDCHWTWLELALLVGAKAA